jgi:butyryl-CoA dehydrogenase
LAIQVHGGYGYTRDFAVEQYWRDNRLNMIHEGTHGIQAADLLGRKVRMEAGRGLQLLGDRMARTQSLAQSRPEFAEFAHALDAAWQEVLAATQAAWAGGDAVKALANAVPYMQAFGHTVLAWMWLDVACAGAPHASAPEISPAQQGREAAMRFFFNYELPKIPAWLGVVARLDLTCANLPEEAF